MEIEAVCRICLCTETSKDFSDLKSQENDMTSSEILFFCLSIQLQDSTVKTKLCLECFQNIIYFNNFKLLALKNDAYLKKYKSSLNVKSKELKDLQCEDFSLVESELDEIQVDAEVKLEPLNYEQDELFQSGDELLSDREKIEYEFIPWNSTESSKNADIKSPKDKKGKRKKNIPKESGISVKKCKPHHKHTKSDILKLPCLLCDETFRSYKARSYHKKLIHLGGKETCKICNKEVAELKKHNLLKHDPSKLRYECTTCGKRFLLESTRRKHAIIHTSKRPRFECDICGKILLFKNNLLAHKRSIHDKVKPHLCHFCSKTFSDKGDLKNHLRIHTNEKPYLCKECGSAFSCSTGLRNHQHSHLDETPYECAECGKKFKAKRYLAHHMVTHTRVKRYPCPYCDWKFHRSDHVKQHVVAVHKLLYTRTPKLVGDVQARTPRL